MVLACVLASVGAVVLFRFVPVPVSALMVERRVASWFSDKPYQAHHRWVPLERIAPSMGCRRDRRRGPELRGPLRLRLAGHREGHGPQRAQPPKKRGASTLTQQTAKNLFLWESRTWVRKGLEVYFTLLLETFWSKRRILEVYLNSVEFGDGVYGVEAASRTFFGRPAGALSGSQAALLAAVLPSPRRYRADAPAATCAAGRSGSCGRCSCWAGTR